MTPNCSKARCKVCKKNFVTVAGEICSDCSQYPEDNFSNQIPEYQCDICDRWVSDILMSRADQKICKDCWESDELLECESCGLRSPDFENDFHYHDLCNDCYNNIHYPKASYSCTECGDIIDREYNNSRSLCEDCANRMDSTLIKNCKTCNEPFRAFNYPYIADQCKYCLADKMDKNELCKVCGVKVQDKSGFCNKHKPIMAICPGCNKNPIENYEMLCKQCLDDKLYDSSNR